MLIVERGFRNRKNRYALVLPTAILGLAGLALMCGQTVRSQFGADNPFGRSEKTQHDFPHAAVSNESDKDHITAERQKIALNLQRQKQLVTDSDKLLKLAKELNDEVAVAGPGPLTQEQLDKLNKIEKLARSVKEGMLDRADEPAPAVSGTTTEIQ
ncbi:MAG: hypothetical protein WBP85_09775 [Terracidiphilus sp.]